MALITMKDIEGISPVFKGKFGNELARLTMRITGIDQLSERYGRHEDTQQGRQDGQIRNWRGYQR